MSLPVFEMTTGSRFAIGPAAWARMCSFLQDTPQKREAGGVLLGRFIIGSDDVVVDEVTGPLTGDRRGRYNFFRSAKPHQTILDHQWRASGGTCLYLGEWHTHAEETPSPSTIDWRNWRRILAHDVYDSDGLFFLIIGRKTLKAWRGLRNPEAITLLGEWPIVEKERVEDADTD